MTLLGKKNYIKTHSLLESLLVGYSYTLDVDFWISKACWHPFWSKFKIDGTMMSPIKQISVSEMDRGINDGGLVRLWQVF